MTDTLDPTIVREIAQTAGLIIVENIACDHIVHKAMAQHGIGHDNVDAWSETYDRVLDELAAVLKPLTRPDEQPQDERGARIAELEREVRQLRAGAPRAWKTDWRDPISRFENFVNVTRSYDSDHLGGIMRGDKAEATITLGDLRAVLARLAELERLRAERDGKPVARCPALSTTRLRLQCSRPEGHDAAHVADLDGMGRFSWHGDIPQQPEPCPCGCEGSPDECTCGGACRCGSDCPHCDLLAYGRAQDEREATP